MLSDLDLSFSNNDETQNKERDIFQVRAKVMKALKLSLHRTQYEQVLESLRNMSTTTDANDVKKTEGSGSSEKTEPQLDKELTAPSLSGRGGQANSQENSAIVEGSFEIPHLLLELRGDMLKQQDHGLSLIHI